MRGLRSSRWLARRWPRILEGTTSCACRQSATVCSSPRNSIDRQTPLAGTDAPHIGISRTSIAVAAFSTIVEWYDFTLYLYLATVLSRVFFGGSAAALITTLAAFAIAY